MSYGIGDVIQSVLKAAEMYGKVEARNTQAAAAAARTIPGGRVRAD